MTGSTNKLCTLISMPIKEYKIVITALTLCVVGDVIRALLGETGEFLISTAFYTAAVIKLFTYSLCLYLTVLSKRRGLTSPCVIWLFWLLQVVANVIPFYSLIIQWNKRSLVELCLFYIHYGGVLAEIVLCSFAERIDDAVDPSSSRTPCPGNKASFLSKMIFSWTFNTLWTGWRQDLKAEDIYDLPPSLKSEVTVPPFLKNFKGEQQRTARLNTAIVPRDDTQESQGLLEMSETSDQSRKRGKILPDIIVKDTDASKSKLPDRLKKPSLVRTLFKTYWLEMMKSHAYRIIAECFYVIDPLLLKSLIQYIEHRDVEPVWKGYGIVVGFALISAIDSIILSISFFTAENLSLKVRTALTSAIYKKALTMNTESRKKYTTGEIVNLMSVDVLRIEMAIFQMWILWSSPILFIACFYQLYQVMGLSFSAGICIILALSPVLLKLFLKVRQLFNEQLKYKDERLKHTGELLNGIKVLKLYAWEGSFRDKVMAVRDKEVKVVMKIAIMASILTFTWIGAPTLIIVACFLTYVMTSSNKFLDSETAFVSLSLFNMLKVPMNLLPLCISTLTESSVSLERLTNYLAGDELDPNMVSSSTAEGTAVSIDRATFTWGLDIEPTLKNVTLSVPDGQLVAVVGSVGAGKSSLISAMLGEMLKVKGHVALKGNIAYVPQEAWIQNLSLKRNMLFGCNMDSKRYREVISACALVSDIDVLPGGANTEIGEKGINLSGGQKQRVSLARAVYSDRDIYLMDDPLSAVDSHVGKHIFNHVIGNQGLLKDKTRILVTHGVHWLPMVDVIVVIDQGEITEMGSYEELLGHDGPFAQFLKTYLLQHKTDDNNEDEELQEIRSQILERVDSVTSLSVSPSLTSNLLTPSSSQAISPLTSSHLRHRGSNTHLSASLSSVVPVTDLDLDLDLGIEPCDLEEDDDKGEHKLIDEEYTEVGNVKFTVWKSYLSALGWLTTLGVLALFFLYNLSWVSSNIWLSIWTEDPRLKSMVQGNLKNMAETQQELNSSAGTLTTGVLNGSDISNGSLSGEGMNITEGSIADLESLSYYYLGVFSVVTFLQAIFALINLLLIYIKTVKAARIMHEKLLDNIIRQPMSFFDTTPTGRILNRFTRDVDIVDNHIPRVLRMWVEFLFNLLNILIVIAYSTPLFLAVAVPIMIFFLFVQRMYTPTSRQLRRFFSASKSPIYSHFTETINGATTVRAYKAQDRFLHSNLMRVNENNVFFYGAVTTHRWMKIRLDVLGCLVIVSASLLGILSPDISPGVLGLSISYALQVTGCLIMMVIITTELETNVVSVERMAQYSSLPTEADWILPDRRPPKDWPSNGHIKFDNLKIRYRNELDLVLKGITCEIKPGEKIGVVGRTGAGKTSLTLALFRILEAAEGRILIDGHDIADMGLHDLRSRLTILPQDPVLFSGTLRLNLDPFEEHSDQNLWLALERAHLKDFVSGLSEGLLHQCDEGGHNLSVGQRQLVCLARSLLRRTRILVLDEATAAVDMETDELIQKTIRTAFHDCTVITIAHRLNTILDYDRILVLSAGEIVEFDRPDSLLEDTSSIFYSLAKDANIVK